LWSASHQHSDYYDLWETRLWTYDVREPSEVAGATFSDTYAYPGPSVSDRGDLLVPTNDTLLFYSLDFVETARVPLQGGQTSTAPAVDAEGTIYVGTDAGTVAAVSSAGELRWSAPTPGTPFNRLAVGRDSAIFGFSAVVAQPGETGWSAFALEPDGALRWSAPAGVPLASPALGQRGELLLVTNDAPPEVAIPDPNDFKIVALDPDTGERLWETSLGRPGYSPVIAADGTVIVAINDEDTQQGTLVFLSGRSGRVQHRTTNFDGWIAEPAVASDGDIFLGCGEFMCRVSKSGRIQERWTVQGTQYDEPGHYVVGAPMLLRGKVIAIRDDGWGLTWDYNRNLSLERRSWSRNGASAGNTGRVVNP